MKVLVTGGAGFIGSHIVDKLTAAHHEVVVVDNLSTGNVKNLNPKAKFYRMDITSEEVEAVFEAEKPEVVIHEAAQIDVQLSIKNPVLDARTNILGTVNLLESCRKSGVEKIIYASSAAVYGNPEYLGVDEKHRVAPLSFYGISKHTPEHYIAVYSQLYGIKYTILRYANVYGIRQDPKGEGGVISIFLDRMLKGQQVVIFGDGEQTRDFIYVEDVAEANVKALSLGDNEIINISTNQAISINELFDKMKSIMKADMEPSYGPARPGDIVHSYLDHTKALRLLDWKPAYPIREGLEKTIEYYRACQA